MDQMMGMAPVFQADTPSAAYGRPWLSSRLSRSAVGAPTVSTLSTATKRCGMPK